MSKLNSRRQEALVLLRHQYSSIGTGSPANHHNVCCRLPREGALLYHTSARSTPLRTAESAASQKETAQHARGLFYAVFGMVSYGAMKLRNAGCTHVKHIRTMYTVHLRCVFPAVWCSWLYKSQCTLPYDGNVPRFE